MGSYYTSVSLTRNTQAKAEDINTRTESIETGFDKLPNPHASAPGTKGFSEVFKIVDATGRDHPIAAGQVQDQGPVYAADSGTANTYAVTLAPAVTAYTAGLKVSVKIANANTGASTLNVNALGAKSIKKFGSSALSGGELAVGTIAELTYDGTNFQLDAWAGTNAPLLDEDDMASDSAVSAASQQSIATYVKADAHTLTNKTLTSPIIGEVLSSSGAGTMSVPDATDTFVGKATTDTLTNKTLTAPIIGEILSSSGAGTISVPNATDTLVGKATTDTLTNKTISAGSNTLDNALTALAGTTAAANKLPYFTGTSGASTTDITADMRTLLDNTVAKGDLIYGSAANVLAQLAISTANYKLFTNAAGDGPEWASGVTRIDITRLHNAAAGDVAYTGVGFKPSMGIFLCARASGDDWGSIGLCGPGLSDRGIWFYNGSDFYTTSNVVYSDPGTGGATMQVKTWDSDGFTGTWTQGGSAFNITVYAFFLR